MHLPVPYPRGLRILFIARRVHVLRVGFHHPVFLAYPVIIVQSQMREMCAEYVVELFRSKHGIPVQRPMDDVFALQQGKSSVNLPAGADRRRYSLR